MYGVGAYVKRIALICLWITLLFIAGGCGGGTVGTDGGGGGSTKILGLIQDSRGEPVVGATVEIADNTTTLVTDSNGRFTADQVIETPELTLQINSGGTASRVTLVDLPPQPEAIEVEIEVRERTQKPRVVKQVVRPRPTPRPTSIPVTPVVPTPEPTPIPTVPVDPSVGVPTPIIEPTGAAPEPTAPPTLIDNSDLVDPEKTALLPVLVAVRRGDSEKPLSGLRLSTEAGSITTNASSAYRGWRTGVVRYSRSDGFASVRLSAQFIDPRTRRRRVATFTLQGRPEPRGSMAAPLYLVAITNSTTRLAKDRIRVVPLSSGWSVSPRALVPLNPSDPLSPIGPPRPPENETEYIVNLSLPAGFDPTRVLSSFVDGEVPSVPAGVNRQVDLVTNRMVLFGSEQPSSLRFDIALRDIDGRVASVTTPLSNARQQRAGNEVRARLEESNGSLGLVIE
jgi:hypothetical protein